MRDCIWDHVNQPKPERAKVEWEKQKCRAIAAISPVEDSQLIQLINLNSSYDIRSCLAVYQIRMLHLLLHQKEEDLMQIMFMEMFNEYHQQTEHNNKAVTLKTFDRNKNKKCSVCKKKGHLKNEYWKLKKKNAAEVEK